MCKSDISLIGKLRKDYKTSRICKIIFLLFIYLLFHNQGIAPILDDRLKEKSWNPERVPTVVTLSVRLSVRLSVCKHATGHTFSTKNLIFGLNNPWDMRKKRIFLFFEIFIFSLFIGIFRFFPYITLVNFWFQASGHSFLPRNLILGLRFSQPKN